MRLPTFDPFNAPEPHAVDIHLKAFSPHLIAVPLIGLIVNKKRTTATYTDMILFPFSMSILPDVGGSTVRALHGVFTQSHLSIMQHLDIPVYYLQHLSPLGWERINLTGDYVWNFVASNQF